MEIKPVVLCVDDEEDLIRTLSIVLRKNFEIYSATSGLDALDILNSREVDVVLCDISMTGLSGLEVLSRIKNQHTDVEVIMLTALNDTRLAVQAAREGAFDYLVKPVDAEALQLHILRAYEKKRLLFENTSLKQQLANISEHNCAGMIGASAPIRTLFDQIRKVSHLEATVLIQGETGTGKELVAKAIHQLSVRQSGPFVAVNCGAIPRELFESEIFGHEKGAFTGAVYSKPGKFEAASQGTLFLDEISSLPYEMQVKFLRVIQEREVFRIGGATPVALDVRIIAASNEDIRKKVAAGEFREDLYQRLAVIPLTLPPLRNRQDDIKLLTWYFIHRANQKYAKNFLTVDDVVWDVFSAYDWPGNVRELEHLVERIVAMEESDLFKSAFLPLEFWTRKTPADKGSPLKEMLQDYEKGLIQGALIKSDHNQSKAAQLLGISRTTLISKMENYEIKGSVADGKFSTR